MKVFTALVRGYLQSGHPSDPDRCLGIGLFCIHRQFAPLLRNTVIVAYRLLDANAIRVRDPFLTIDTRWVSRRLSPESHKIEFDALKDADNWLTLLMAMGAELANNHVGTAATIEPILKWIKKRGDIRIIEASMVAASIVQDLHEELKASA